MLLIADLACGARALLETLLNEFHVAPRVSQGQLRKLREGAPFDQSTR